MEKETGRTEVSYREMYPLGAAWTKRNWTKNISRSQVVCRCIFHLKCKYPNFIFFGKIKNNIQEFEYNSFGLNLSLNNFVTTFNFIEDNASLNNANYFETTSKFDFDKSNSVSFKTRRNREVPFLRWQ